MALTLVTVENIVTGTEVLQCDLVFNTTVGDPLGDVSAADPAQWSVRYQGVRYTGTMLTNLASDDDIRYELQTSAERIMKEAGHQAETISYPIGSFDNRVTRIASECGYKWGLAVKQRFFDYGKDDTMAIPRLELYEEPWLKVQMRRFGLISKLRAVWS